MLEAMKAEATEEFRERTDKFRTMGSEIKLGISTMGMIGQDCLDQRKD